MKLKKTLTWITTTAMLIALLIVCQWGLGSLTGNNQYVVGAAVNLVLIVAATVGGLYCGLTVAALSPFFAFLLGVGPQFIQIIPFIALGNIMLVLICSLLDSEKIFKFNQYARLAIADVLGAGLKCLTLYLCIAKLMVPVLLNGSLIPEKAAATLSATFGISQMITALIGGTIALAIVPMLKKALKK